MSSSYRALFARPGARSLALSCGLGWLSFCSYGLAIVLAVHAAAGSFAVAGAAVAAFSAGSAVFAPLRGRFVDRRGPHALAVLAPPHAAALALVVVGCALSAGSWVLVAGAALAGSFTPPLIATARAVWPQVAGPDLARAGHAMNAALGDAAQVVGPAFVAGLAVIASADVALALLIPGVAAGASIIARRAPAPASVAPPRPTHRVFGVLRESAALRVIVICELLLGLAFGAVDVAAPAMAADEGATELAAVPLIAFAVGSIAASVWSGRESLRLAAASRYLVGSLVVAAVLLLCLVTTSIGGLAVVLAGAGAGYGVLNVALFELLEEVVASDRAVEAFTWLTTWSGLGLAAGAAGAGQLASNRPQDALLLVALPAVAAAVVAGARRRVYIPAAGLGGGGDGGALGHGEEA